MQTDNVELKKLVYLYLMNYAKSQPDLAIMAVNTFVKVPFYLFLFSKLLKMCFPGLWGPKPTDPCVGCENDGLYSRWENHRISLRATQKMHEGQDLYSLFYSFYSWQDIAWCIRSIFPVSLDLVWFAWNLLKNISEEAGPGDLDSFHWDFIFYILIKFKWIGGEIICISWNLGSKVDLKISHIYPLKSTVWLSIENFFQIYVFFSKK